MEDVVVLMARRDALATEMELVELLTTKTKEIM